MSIKTELDAQEVKLQNCKSKIATAITEKGIPTSNTATLDVMATNITKIQQGSGGSPEKPISELVMPVPKQVSSISSNPYLLSYYNNDNRGHEYYLFPDSYMNAINLHDSSFSKYGTLRKRNGGYDVIEKTKMVEYSINNYDYTSVFAIDTNYNLYAGYSYMDYVQSNQFYYSDAELNNIGLTNLSDIQNIFTINTIGMAIAINGSGEGYFIFPLGPNEYSSGYAYKSINSLVGETVDFSTLNNDILYNQGDLTIDFNPACFIESESQIILVNNSKIYRFDYSLVGEYQSGNYENFITYKDSITAPDNIYCYGIDYPYMYASNKRTSHYYVDLSNHFGNMQVINGMYGYCFKYTKINDKMYSFGKDSMYEMVNGSKGTQVSHNGTALIRNAITNCIGEGENIWVFAGRDIILSKYKDGKWNMYSAISDTANSTLRQNIMVNKNGELIILSSSNIYKLERDPKVTF